MLTPPKISELTVGATWEAITPIHASEPSTLEVIEVDGDYVLVTVSGTTAAGEEITIELPWLRKQDIGTEG